METAVDGKRVTLPLKGTRYTVVALVGTTCPLSQKVSPTLAALEDRFASRGVGFAYLDPSPAETPAELRAAKDRLGWNGPVVHDPDHSLVKRLGAETTTEAFVLDPSGKVLYRGAVDDQYAVGASLPQPRNRFLANALESLLAGKAPAVTATTAPGCLLPTPSSPAPVPTYHGKIQHIVQKHCVPCHRKDGVGPFALEDYASVKARASMLNAVVEKGIMPPWFAAKGTGPWRDDPTIPDSDKAALAAWATGGTPKGDPKQAPKPPIFADSWMLGKPDVVFELPKPVPVKATGTMDYVNIEVPTGFTEDKWIQKIEVQPGDRRVVHHVLVFLSKPNGGGGLLGRLGGGDDIRGFFGAYAPGGGYLAYPDGLAKRLPAGSTLRFQLHYTPNG
ncbi:MAG: redoxin family protein, partial [Armatimonadaceae bacterium]